MIPPLLNNGKKLKYQTMLTLIISI